MLERILVSLLVLLHKYATKFTKTLVHNCRATTLRLWDIKPVRSVRILQANTRQRKSLLRMTFDCYWRIMPHAHATPSFEHLLSVYINWLNEYEQVDTSSTASNQTHECFILWALVHIGEGNMAR